MYSTSANLTEIPTKNCTAWPNVKQEQYQSDCKHCRPLKFHSQSDADIPSLTEIERILVKIDNSHIAAAYFFPRLWGSNVSILGKGWGLTQDGSRQGK
jgi:uncharacterized protein (DUF1499 family)